MGILDKMDVAITYTYTLYYKGGHPDFPKDKKMDVSLKKDSISLQTGTLVPKKKTIFFKDVQQIKLEEKYGEKYLILELQTKGVPIVVSFSGKKAQEAYSTLIKKYMAFKQD